MQCSNCKKEIPDGSDFCSYCGSKQEELLFCYKCGHEIPADSEFCQFCGSTQPKRFTKNKKPVNKGLVIGIGIAIVIIAVAIVFIVLKPFNNKSAPHTGNSIEQPADNDPALDAKKADSDFININEYKKSPSNYNNRNLKLTGYIVKDMWSNQNGFYLAEKQQYPYDYITKEEYFADNPIQAATELERKAKEYEIWPTLEKTPTIFCKCEETTVYDRIPKEGDYVDIYCESDGKDFIKVYCIDYK